MMKIAIIKEYFYQEKRNYLVGILFMVYAFMCGTNIKQGVQLGLSAGEYILLCITNHYYLIYGLFFFGIYWIFKDVKRNSDIELVRYGSYNKYYILRCSIAFVKIFMLVIIHLLIAGCIGIAYFGLTFTFTGNNNKTYYNEAIEYLFAYRIYFPNTIIAIVSVSIFLVIGFFFVYQILFYVQKIKGEKASIIVMIIILINVMFGFKSQYDESFMEVFFLNNYFILHHCLFLVGKMAVYVNLIIVIVMSALLNRLAIGMKRSSKRKINEKYIDNIIYDKKKMYIFIVVVHGLNIIMVILDKYNAFDYLLSCAQGYSGENINILNVLFYMTYFIFPMFVLMCYLERDNKNASILLKIRYGSKKKWNQVFIKSCYGYLIKYSLCYWAVLGVIFIIMKFSLYNVDSVFWKEFLQMYELTNEEMYTHIFSSILLHVFELMIVFEWCYLMYKITKSTTSAFVSVLIAYSASIVFKINEIVNPFGSSSLYNMLERNNNPILQIIINILWIVVIKIVRRKFDDVCNRVV